MYDTQRLSIEVITELPLKACARELAILGDIYHLMQDVGCDIIFLRTPAIPKLPLVV